MAKAQPQEKAQPVGGNAQAELKEYVKRLAHYDDEIAKAKEKHITPLNEGKKAIFAQAKGNGFDAKALKEVYRKSRFNKELREQIDIYEHAVLNELLD
jgi:uncharacterized protein (UPF0335 family)